MPVTDFTPCRSAISRDGVGVDELIGAPIKRAGKRGPTPKLQQQIERLSQLPQAQQRVVMQMLEGFLNQTAKSS